MTIAADAPPARWPWGWIAVFALGYFAGAELGHFLSWKTNSQVLVFVWPPNGLYLAALLLSRRRTWPALLAVACLANVLSAVGIHGRPFQASLGFWLANSLESVLAAALLSGLLGRRFSTECLRHI